MIGTLAERLWAKVDTAGPTPAHRPDLGPCWVWTGARTAPGWHGVIGSERGRRIVSRVAWELSHGPIPAGLSVLHRCDNPPCVRESHLFLGTQRENVRDAAAKGRLGQTRKKAACAHGHAFTPENTYRAPKTGRRQCVTCRHAVSLARAIR